MKENIVNMILERASRYNSREVFRFKKAGSKIYESISWESFAGESQKVSRALISLGIRPSDNIGIFSDNRPEWVISDIGIIGIRRIRIRIKYPGAIDGRRNLEFTEKGIIYFAIQIDGHRTK